MSDWREDLGRIAWGGAVGVSGRAATEVPEWTAQAFDPASGADRRARQRAVADLRAVLVGEGEFTPAGAALLPVLLAAGTGAAPVAPEGLFVLVVDLAWGAHTPTARGLPAAPKRKGPERDIRATLAEAEDALGHALGNPEAHVRAGAALALGAIGRAAGPLADHLDDPDDDVAAAAALALASAGGDPDALARATGPERAPHVRLAAAIAALVRLGDAQAPDLVLRTAASLLDARPGPAFPLPVVLGILAARELLSGPRGAREATAALLYRADVALGRGQAPCDELSLLLEHHLPDGDPGRSEVARRLADRLLHPAFDKSRNWFRARGLPETAFDRRRWLGIPSPLDVADRGPAERLRALEEAYQDGAHRAAARVPAAEVLAAADALPAADARAWASAHLDRRQRWPGAQVAPNGPVALAALLVLGRADPAEPERRWIADHEPVLAALTVAEVPLVRELLGMLPRYRRVDAWRRHLDTFANPAVAQRRALSLAPAVPFPDVALELVARAVTVGGHDELPAVLDTLGEAAVEARARLRDLAGRLSP